ncbi:Unknown protein sequence [Pseudomonas coronafaciens pv. oryzae]|nr:Unknown protein sequence [Pseudomonas coronafaciens pv. oryzae]
MSLARSRSVIKRWRLNIQGFAAALSSAATSCRHYRCFIFREKTF